MTLWIVFDMPLPRLWIFDTPLSRLFYLCVYNRPSLTRSLRKSPLCGLRIEMAVLQLKEVGKNKGIVRAIDRARLGTLVQ